MHAVSGHDGLAADGVVEGRLLEGARAGDDAGLFVIVGAGREVRLLERRDEAVPLAPARVDGPRLRDERRDGQQDVVRVQQARRDACARECPRARDSERELRRAVVRSVRGGARRLRA